jgi:hypothetical protein
MASSEPANGGGDQFMAEQQTDVVSPVAQPTSEQQLALQLARGGMIGDKWVPPSPRLPHHYVPMPMGDGLIYVVDSQDQLLKHAMISDLGVLTYVNTLIPDTDPEALTHPMVVKALVRTAKAIYDSATGMARKSIEYGNEVREAAHEQQHRYPALRIKPPREFKGEDAKGAAMDLPVWLMEVQEWLTLTGVPQTIQAQVACTYLGGRAQSLYNTRRAAESAVPGFVHNMEYMCITMKDLFVPRAQKAIVIHDFLHGKWVIPFDAKWTLEAHCKALRRQKCS